MARTVTAASGPTLTPREKTLLVLYATIAPAQRRTVDRALGAAWTARVESHTVRNKRFREAIRRLRAGDLRVEQLGHFADVGRTSGTRAR